jgi:PAS domain S-box-containing protein
MKKQIYLSGKEREMGDNDIIVSKTNLKGHVIYGNKVFCDIAGYSVAEVMGVPHSILRHPEMPRCVFKLLWDTIEAGKEIFAYVLNLGKEGDHYWVFAHVTPSFDENGKITGYHSNRRKPNNAAVEKIKGVYKILLDEENRAPDSKTGMHNAFNLLLKILEEKGVSYEEFVLSL